jgi:hypothetical protein
MVLGRLYIHMYKTEARSPYLTLYKKSRIKDFNVRPKTLKQVQGKHLKIQAQAITS